MAHDEILEIDGDRHYGNLGLGGMTLLGANTFSTAQISQEIEPDLVISPLKRVAGHRRLLENDIEGILCWDVRKWLPYADVNPDTAGGEDATHLDEGGVTKDNTSAATNPPTANSVAQGTRPGGNVANVVGDAGTATVRPQMVGQDVPAFEAFFDWQKDGVEEQTAVGQILTEGRAWPKNPSSYTYSPYNSAGITVHHLLTAAHYHFWALTTTKQSAAQYSLGINCKRMQVPFNEVMFDREVLLSLLDALVVSS